MIEFINYTVVIALLVAFGITLLQKWGVIEYMQVHGNNFFAKMFGCWFCLSFWGGMMLSILFAALTGNPMLLLVPFCSTMITRNLL